MVDLSSTEKKDLNHLVRQSHDIFLWGPQKNDDSEEVG